MPRVVNAPPKPAVGGCLNIFHDHLLCFFFCVQKQPHLIDAFEESMGSLQEVAGLGEATIPALRLAILQVIVKKVTVKLGRVEVWSGQM